MARTSVASTPESANRKNTHEPSRKRRISPASAISFRCRLMRGWLWPRIWVRSLTLSSPAAARSARMRRRVASPAARKLAKAWARDRPCGSSPDIKICLYVFLARARAGSAAGEVLVFDALRQDRVLAEAALLVLLVIFEIALEPLDVAVALEGQNVGGNAIEKEAVVADDDGAPREILERRFERGQRLDIEVVGRFIEKDQIRARLQHLGEVDAIALAARELAHFLLLVGTLEIEPANIGPGLHLAVPELDHVVAARDLLEHRLLAVERVARLIDITELHRLADADRAFIGFVIADDHAEQRGLAGAVRPDYADNAARRQLEGEIVDQQLFAEALVQLIGFDHDIAETGPGRNGDLCPAALVARRFGEHLLVGADARFGLGLTRLGARPDPVELARKRALARLVLLALDFEPLRFLLEPGRVAPLVGNAGAAIELERPFGDVV